VGVFKGKKRPKGPWDWKIEHGLATEDQYEAYEKALADGNITEAQAIEAQTVSGVKQRKKNN